MQGLVTVYGINFIILESSLNYFLSVLFPLALNPGNVNGTS